MNPHSPTWLRLMTLLNLTGILAMGILCVIQWRRGVHDHQALAQCAADRLELSEELRIATAKAESDRQTIEEFRTRLATAKTELDAAAARQTHVAAQLKAAQDTTAASEAQWQARLNATEAECNAATRSLSEAQQRLSDAKRTLEEQAKTLEAWKAALADRDLQLRTAATESVSLRAARDEAIQRHNALVEQYNALVRRLEEAERALRDADEIRPTGAGH